MRIKELERELDLIGLEYDELFNNREKYTDFEIDTMMTELDNRYDSTVEELVRLYKEELANIGRQMDELYEFEDEWDEFDFDCEMTDLDIREEKLLIKLKLLVG